MEETTYKVSRIEGEYAYLKTLDGSETDELFIALALLPIGVDVGTNLKFENFQFSIIE